MNRNVAPLLVRAVSDEQVERTPVWLMRQAGRYLPEYRELRNKYSFETLTKTPELSARVTLQPVERFDLDAAIVFFDILYVLEALGGRVGFDDNGPRVEMHVEPDRSGEVRLPSEPDLSGFEGLAETLKTVRTCLDRDKALIGFVGGPFTLLTYLSGDAGEQSLAWARKLILGQPEFAKRVLDRLASAAAGLAEMQVRAGADVVQVFDTWAGTLNQRMYEEFALPYAKTVIEAGARLGARTIYFARNTSHLLDRVKELGSDCISLDWTVNMQYAGSRLPAGTALQGNLDPAALLCSEKEVKDGVKDVMESVPGGRGFVFNLGHGVLPETPVSNVGALVEAVKAWERR